MVPQGTSSPAPNQTVGSRGAKSNITHSHRSLEHLTKIAVERAYKLCTDSRRLVHIVETQSCRDSKSPGCSSPFSSALLKISQSATSSSSRNRALSKDSNHRSSVAARIHSLLNQWRPDCSLDWRARVASVVPVLEEVVYKEAKSQEEYTNPQLLESQLMNVLCHFEAGNGPFLLQGCSPLYPVKACNIPSSSSSSMSPLNPHASVHGVSSNGDLHEIVPEETGEALASSQRSTSGSSPVLTQWEANDNMSENICGMKVSTNKHRDSHSSSKIVKKVASMLSKKRKEKSECLKQELERANQEAETVKGFTIHAETEALDMVDRTSCDVAPRKSCHGTEKLRSTLGDILKLNIFNTQSSSVIDAEATPHASSTSAEGMFISHRDEVPLSFRTTDQTSRNMISDSGAGNSDLGNDPDSQIAYAGRHSLLLEIVHPAEGQGVNCECEPNLQSAFLSSTSVSTPSQPALSSSASALSSSSTSASALSSSSTSASPPCRSMLYSPSLSSTSAPSPSQLILPHSALLASPLPVCSSSSALAQEHFIQDSITCFNPLPKHESSSFSEQLTTLPASSDVPSMEHNCLERSMSDDHQNVQNHNRRRIVLLQAEEQSALIASGQTTTQTTPEKPRKIERGESSATSSMTALPAAGNEDLIEPMEKKVKLPLRTFLAEREEYTSFKKGGPWDTWEEATEPLDGMCCVCMVGFKGAAFIPCGHTFCRKCTRELWRGRGTCPLCNRYIREILDIY